MRRASFWFFLIGSAAVFAYLLDLVFLSTPKLSRSSPRPLAEAPGNPIFSPLKIKKGTVPISSRAYTNEEIYRNLQKQTVKMGIEDILSPKEKNSQNDSLPPWLRKKDDGVYLKGKTPALLKKDEAPN